MKMMQWTVCAGLLILISGAWAQDAQEKGKPPVLQERKEQGDRTQVAKAELEALRADIEQSMKREARLRKMIAAARQLSDGEQYFTPQVLEDLVKVCGGGVTLKSYQMRTKWGYPITKRNSSLGPKPDTQSPMVRRVTIHFSGTVGTEEQLRKFEKRLEKTNLLSSIELDYFWRPKDPKKPSSFYIHCRVRPDAKLFEPLAKFVLSNLPQPKPLPPKLGPAKNSTNVSKAKLDQSIALAKRDKAAAAAKADSASAQMDAILKADAGETDKVDLQVAIGEIRALAAESKLECVLKTRNGGPHPLVGTKAYKAYSLTIQAQGRYEGYRAFLSRVL